MAGSPNLGLAGRSCSTERVPSNPVLWTQAKQNWRAATDAPPPGTLDEAGPSDAS